MPILKNNYWQAKCPGSVGNYVIISISKTLHFLEICCLRGLGLALSHPTVYIVRSMKGKNSLFLLNNTDYRYRKLAKMSSVRLLYKVTGTKKNCHASLRRVRSWTFIVCFCLESKRGQLALLVQIKVNSGAKLTLASKPNGSHRRTQAFVASFGTWQHTF